MPGLAKHLFGGYLVGMMMRFLTSFCAAAVLATAANAEKLSLDEISGYFNRLKTSEAEFTQINDDGTISTGKIFIKRPGKMRFEYNPPDSALVVVGSNEVLIVDKKSNQMPESYPLKRTPLSIILANNVDLEREDMVTGHDFDGTATTVTAQDPEHPEYGNIQLLFTAGPVELRQWVVNDDSGSQTTIILGEMDRPDNLPNSLFDVLSLKQVDSQDR